MDYGKKYLENQIMTSNPVSVTIIIFEDLLQKCEYIEKHFDKNDIESFESDQALEKLDRLERMVEELHMEIANFTESPFPSIANSYKEIINGVIRFKENYSMDIIRGIVVVVTGLKEAYEGVLKKDGKNR